MSDRASSNVPTKPELAPADAGTNGKQPVCFVIMPISDVDPYAPGHFRRVYEYIIKPACERAGLRPVRADDVNQTNHIVLDVLRHLLGAEMAVCDLSARNANVFYELGVRQAFNKPVTLLKDLRTPRVFDIQGLRDIEYDEGLRVDTVAPTVDSLAESMRNTLVAHTTSDAGQVNSLVQLLGVHAASLPQPQELSLEGSLVLSAVSELSSRIRDIEAALRPRNLGFTPGLLSGFTAASKSESLWPDDLDSPAERSRRAALAPGGRVVHQKFGTGTVHEILGAGRDAKIRVLFDDPSVGQKTLVLSQTRLTSLADGSAEDSARAG